MYEFKRTHTEFCGGDVPRHINDPMGRQDYLPRQSVKIIGVREEDEDTWTVATPSGERYVVDGCDLSPHPDRPATNVEFITHLMENATTGPLMQGFVIEAVAKYAEQCATMTDEDRAGFGMVNPAAWQAVAAEALAEINAKYKPSLAPAG